MLKKITYFPILLLLISACGETKRNVHVDNAQTTPVLRTNQALNPFFTPNYSFNTGYVVYNVSGGVRTPFVYNNQAYLRDRYQVVCHSGIKNELSTYKKVIIARGENEFETKTFEKRYEVKVTRTDKLKSTCIKVDIYEDVFGPNNPLIKTSSRTFTNEYLLANSADEDRFVGLTDDETDYTVNCFVKLR